MSFRIIRVAFAAVLFAGAASAQETGAAGAAAGADECVTASPPDRLIIVKPVEPALPACAQKNNCSKSAADKYNLEILTYNRAIAQANEVTGDYVNKLNDYARAAGRYANCEIDRLNRETLD